ncbi:MAG: hypothetical protein PHG48_07960, partial [Eubacteriales bacterium]|nr:hypothetical protein [Eubacteriales bacterium]
MNINPKTDALNNSGKAGDKIDDGIIDDRIFVRISNYDYNPSYDICVEVAKIHGSFFSAFDKSMEFSVDGSCIYAKIPPGTTALRVIEALDVRSPLSIMGVRIDNEPHELTKPLTGNCCLEFIYDNEEEGVRIYRHSLLFMLIKAVYDLYPERTVHICHSISKGLYCEITAPPVYSAPLEMSRRNRGTFISPALSPSSHSNHVYKLTAREVSTIEKRMRQLRDMKISFREHAAQGNDLFRYFYGRLT